MILWREARVSALVREWDGALEYEVDVVSEGHRGRCRALAYPALVGRPEPGELVLLNSTALERGLGTGGFALIVAVPGRLPLDPPMGPGHLVKARYTPLQAMVLGVDEQESPHHQLLAEADDLLGMPVVVADLHSSVPAIIAGLRHRTSRRRVAYVMTDGGALPAWFSRTIAGLRAAGWIDTCITAGQAFGGDLEAASVHSALLAACHVAGADVAIVSQGPGNLGTGTKWGFSGVQAGEVINAAAALRGRPVATLRISGADPRDRHRGVSHHSRTAYGRVALAAADLPVPDLSDDPDEALAAVGRLVDQQVKELIAPHGIHHEIRVGLAGLREALDACPVPLSTMGRALAADPAAFLAAAAAGTHAATLISL